PDGRAHLVHDDRSPPPEPSCRAGQRLLPDGGRELGCSRAGQVLERPTWQPMDPAGRDVGAGQPDRLASVLAPWRRGSLAAALPASRKCRRPGGPVAFARPHYFRTWRRSRLPELLRPGVLRLALVAYDRPSPHGTVQLRTAPGRGHLGAGAHAGRP